MPATTWKIIDEKNLNRGPQGPFRASGKHEKGEWNIAGTAYDDGLRSGVDVIALDNGRLRLDVVPTRGMGIHQVALKGDQEVPVFRPISTGEHAGPLPPLPPLAAFAHRSIARACHARA